MFELCLFDLDETLVRTGDMREIREAGVGDHTDAYKASVRNAFSKRPDRMIYQQALLDEARRSFSQTKFGIFTRSPRAYALSVLAEAFPEFSWDIVIAYEDVRHTKPRGEGIHKAMQALGIESPDKVVLVGDGDSDVRAGYNSGCVVALDRSDWGPHRSSDNWHALDHMPDVILEKPADLIAALGAYREFLPELERALSGHERKPAQLRFDRVGKFIPAGLGGDKTPYQVYTCGRSFARYESLDQRRRWHALTRSIQDSKESDVFPQEWIDSIRAFICERYPLLNAGPPLVVTVVPHRPGRKARLESLLAQIGDAISQNPFPGSNTIAYEPKLLAYRDGVLSNSNDKLNRLERFANVKDHLYVNRPATVEGKKRVLIIDDVCTSGASLIYAGKYLEDAGSGEVTRLSVSMNVSDVLW